MIAQTNSTKKLKVGDIMKFSWDEQMYTGITEISNDDVERLKEKAKIYGERFSNTTDS